MVLVLLLVVGIVIRVIRLDYLELFGDELDAGYQAYSLMLTGRDYRGNLWPVYAESFSESRAPLLMYTMVPFVKIFGLNELGIRLPSVFWGVVGVVGFYYLLCLLKVKWRVAMISVGFLVVSPWHIQYSRSGFELTLMSVLIIWGLFFLIRGLEKNKNGDCLMAGIFFGLSFYAYNTANVYVPLLILAVLVVWGRSIKLIWQKKNSLFLVGLIMMIMAIPLLKEILLGQGAERFKLLSIWTNDLIISEINEYRNLFSGSFWSRVFFNKAVYTVKRILLNYGGAFSFDFLFGRGDVTFRHSLQKVGNLFSIQAFLIVLGLVSLARAKKSKKSWRFMLMFLLLSPIPACLTIDGVNHASRLFLMVFPLSYFSALGVDYLVGKEKKVLLVFLGLIFVFELVNFQLYYWTSYKRESWRWWHYGYKEIMLGLDKLRGDQKVLIEATYEPSLIRYLFWTTTNPRRVFDLIDKLESDVDGFEGFCLDEKTCFVNYGDDFGADKLRDETIYLVNQEKNVGGDWDWFKNPPEGINVLQKVEDTWGKPLFYLVEKI